MEHEPSIKSAKLRKWSASSGFILYVWRIAGRNAIGVGEQYHAPLGRVSHSLRLYDASEAVKAINKTMGPDGIVSSLLVYGRLLRIPNEERNPFQVDRRTPVTAPITKGSPAACETRITRALQCQLPPTTHLRVRPGDRVRIHREVS